MPTTTRVQSTLGCLHFVGNNPVTSADNLRAWGKRPAQNGTTCLSCYARQTARVHDGYLSGTCRVLVGYLSGTDIIQNCRVVHGGVRRSRRTLSHGGQLGELQSLVEVSANSSRRPARALLVAPGLRAAAPNPVGGLASPRCRRSGSPLQPADQRRIERGIKALDRLPCRVALFIEKSPSASPGRSSGQAFLRNGGPQGRQTPQAGLFDLIRYLGSHGHQIRVYGPNF